MTNSRWFLKGARLLAAGIVLVATAACAQAGFALQVTNDTTGATFSIIEVANNNGQYTGNFIVSSSPGVTLTSTQTEAAINATAAINGYSLILTATSNEETAGATAGQVGVTAQVVANQGAAKANFTISVTDGSFTVPTSGPAFLTADLQTGTIAGGGVSAKGVYQAGGLTQTPYLGPITGSGQMEQTNPVAINPFAALYELSDVVNFNLDGTGQANFTSGATVSGTNVIIPEPTSMTLAIVGIPLACAGLRRWKRAPV